MKQVHSAKDKAFEAERAKFRQRIRELEAENHSKLVNEYELREELRLAHTKISEQDEWIDRLCEHIDITRDEFLASTKSKQLVSSYFGMIGAVGGGNWTL